MELIIIKHNDILFRDILRAIAVKNVAWRHPVESQLKWIIDNMYILEVNKIEELTLNKTQNITLNKNKTTSLNETQNKNTSYKNKKKKLKKNQNKGLNKSKNETLNENDDTPKKEEKKKENKCKEIFEIFLDLLKIKLLKYERKSGFFI